MTDQTPLRDELRRLLILDDDALVAATVSAVARASGFEVAVAKDATAFFVFVDSWNPTHIALDLRMPEMDGLEVIAALASRRSRARLIIASGVGDRVLAAAARSAREHGLTVAAALGKPFTVPALRAALLRIDSPLGVLHGPASTEAIDDPDPSMLEHEVAEIVDTGALTIALQPKVRCADETVAGFEVLARWPSGLSPVQPPSTFLPVASRLGIMDRVTDIVLTRAASWLRDRPSRGGEPLTIAVNVPAGLVSDGIASRDGIRSFEVWAGDRCSDLGIDPERVIFELTETDAMSDSVTSLDVLTRLRMKGFHLSIDDFGTGYSSLGRLARLPFSELKIDRSFVSEMGQSVAAETIVRTAIELAHGLRLECVAEGVEDAGVLASLRDLGCDLAQGYHLARPMDPDAASEWLSARSGRRRS